MGLTSESSGINLLRSDFNIKNNNNPIIALAGNPNTGKSTVFNELTGLKQHTGNWPGKTVTQAQGYFTYQRIDFTLVDLPGTYSLLANSSEEVIARDFICFAKPDVTVVVADATNLERNLNLVLQIAELTDRVILCLNLMDEAKRKGIQIDVEGLKKDLKIPVIPTVAREGKGLKKLKETIYKIVRGDIVINPTKIKYTKEITEALKEIELKLEEKYSNIKNIVNLNWLALRLLEGDETIIKSLKQYLYPEKSVKINKKRRSK